MTIFAVFFNIKIVMNIGVAPEKPYKIRQIEKKIIL